MDNVRLKCTSEMRYTYRKNKESDIHQAVINNDLEALKLFINRGMDINIMDEYSRLPIAYIKEESQLDVLDILLAAGSNIYKLDELGTMQFSMAFRSGHEEVIKKYLKYEIDLNMTDSNGQTAIHYLMDNQCEDNTILEKLNFNVDVEDQSGQTPMLLAIKNENLKWVRLLLEKGAKINYVFKRKSSPLYENIRSMCGYIDFSNLPISNMFKTKCIALMLEKGAEIDEMLHGSYTFFSFALKFYQPKYWKSILRKLAIIEASGSSIIEINRESIEKHYLANSYYYELKAELERMKRVKLRIKVSFFKILFEENIITLAKYFKSVESKMDFEINLRDFCHYAHILKRKYDIAVQIQNEVSKKEEMLSEIFYLNLPPHVIRKIVVFYFSDDVMPDLTYYI